jgi:hypothetical protein
VMQHICCWEFIAASLLSQCGCFQMLRLAGWKN